MVIFNIVNSENIFYQMATQKALVLHEYGKTPVFKDFPKPEPKDGQLLIKVEGSPIGASPRGGEKQDQD